jgi:hypothetical protein
MFPSATPKTTDATIPSGTRIGESTHSQLQLTTPTNLITTKLIVRRGKISLNTLYILTSYLDFSSHNAIVKAARS